MSRSSTIGANLGSARAETDQALKQVFVQTSDFEALARGPNQSFVVGRRGAGKSALFLMLGLHFRRARDAVVVELRPVEYQVKGVCAAVRRRLPPDPDYRRVKPLMRVVWQAVLLEHAIEVTARYHSDPDVKGRASEVQAAPWRRTDLLSSAKALLDGIPIAKDPDEDVSEIASVVALDHNQRLVRQILTPSGARAIILVDGLDEGWRRESVEAGVVGGLAAAAIDLREKETATFPILFLRDNVYRLLGELDEDFSRNIAGDTIRLHWDHNSLFNLTAERLRVLRHHSPKDTPAKIWDSFARRELARIDGFKNCLRHTLYRPRDVLELFNSALQIAQREGRNEIVPSDVDNAAVHISSARLDDLRKEYEAAMPGLTAFVNAFSGRPEIDRLDNILSWLEQLARNHLPQDAKLTFARLGSASEVVHMLYTVGFLGIEKSGQGYKFCHDGAEETIDELPRDTKVAVHPCYARALGVRIATQNDFDVLVSAEDDAEAPSNADIVSARLRSRMRAHWGELGSIPEGAQGAHKFVAWVLRALKLLFSDSLKELESNPNARGATRRDIAGVNEARKGLWKRLENAYQASHVAFEVKNYEDLTPDDYRQAETYASSPYGKLCFIVFRCNRTQLTANERSHLQDIWTRGKLVVLIPSELLVSCLRKQFQEGQGAAHRKFSKWVSNHERKFVNPLAGKHADLLDP